MDKKYSIYEVLQTFGCLPFIVSFLFLFSCLFNIPQIYQNIVDGDIKLLCSVFGAVFFVIVEPLLVKITVMRDNFMGKEIQIKNEFEKHRKDLEKKYNDKQTLLQKQVNDKETEIARRERIVHGFVESLDKHKYCAKMIADFRTVVYDKAADMLTHRIRPALASAEVVRQLKMEARSYLEELNCYKYKEKERISAIERSAQQKISDAYAQCDEKLKAVELAENLLKIKTPFKEVACLYADALDVVYGNVAKELREKVRPAFSRADIIEQELRKKIRETAFEAKNLNYRLNFMLNIFPEINDYLYDDSSLISLAEYNSITDYNDNRDNARDYLSQDEYDNLSEVEKYQLSLDRYKERRRGNAWVAGVEYEMYCCHLLKREGFYVNENGIKMRKADLGRDIIAYKNGNTYIIQCKRYSMRDRNGDEKYIHENVICQLYGTTIEYQLANPDNTLFADYNRIIPVLYTTGQLSDMAKAFAERLRVKVVPCNMGDYPMIKCNINNGERIYHLPFDQQYWNTRIEKSGECYAWTVEEAVQKGFRRAKKWLGETK